MSEKPPRDFWEAAFSPNRDFIAVFLIVLLVMTLVGNLLYTGLTDADTLTSDEIIITFVVILVLSLVAGFIWENRKAMQILFNVTESQKLQRSEAVIAIPSNVGTIGKIVRYHAGILRHLWLVGDSSQDQNFAACEKEYEGDILKLHRTRTGESEARNIYEGYKQAIEATIALGIPANQIIVDITGGTKPMSISAFVAALERGLKVSYVQSNYEQIQGSDEIKRAGEEFAVIEFDMSSFPFDIVYAEDSEE